VNQDISAHHEPKGIYDEIGLWMAILADLIIFTLMFGTVLYYRSFNPELYNTSQQALNQPIALVNTLFLLSSSFFVVLAVRSAKQWEWVRARWHVLGGIVFGLGFVGMKVIEYRQKIDAGITPQTNEFFMFYYMTTILHLVHVILGILLLVIIRAGMPKQKEVSHGRLFALEAGGVFWHMVDLLWVVLMAVVYLAR
jgi:nitric oxide reductase NorE protein